MLSPAVCEKVCFFSLEMLIQYYIGYCFHFTNVILKAPLGTDLFDHFIVYLHFISSFMTLFFIFFIHLPIEWFLSQFARGFTMQSLFTPNIYFA